jgi:DNA repair protein RecN (Recombination protein N)
MIFDEVDSGIGGKVGGMVGLYLNEIAETNQVLVVTHLAQIASCADAHLVVEKFSRDERTETVVKMLERESRTHEIARMLGGDSESETSLAHARQMLKRTQNGVSSS